MKIIFQIILTALFAFIIGIISKKWDKDINIIIPIISAIGSVLLLNLWDLIGKKLSDPHLKINFSNDLNYIDVILTKIKKPIYSLTMDIPILGTVQEVKNLNSISDASPPFQLVTNLQDNAKKMVGSLENRKATFQNRVELLMSPL